VITSVNLQIDTNAKLSLGLIFAGNFEFFNTMAVGGLLQFDIDTKTASPFTKELFPSVKLFGIAAFPNVLGDQLIVFGDFNTTINNPYRIHCSCCKHTYKPRIT
jgi:hypothetical protein